MVQYYPATTKWRWKAEIHIVCSYHKSSHSCKIKTSFIFFFPNLSCQNWQKIYGDIWRTNCKCIIETFRYILRRHESKKLFFSSVWTLLKNFCAPRIETSPFSLGGIRENDLWKTHFSWKICQIRHCRFFENSKTIDVLVDKYTNHLLFLS